MVKSKKASSPHSAVTSMPSSQEVALRVASCNLRADLCLETFDPTLHIMIEFLKSHPIHKPLTKSVKFPLSIIHMAYCTAVYNSKEEYIEFNISKDHTTKLCKAEFLKAIGLPESKEKKTLYEPTNEELFDVFDQMGYLPPRLEMTPNFKKGKLPAMWQFLVHIILRCLTGKTGGTDTLSRVLLVFLFGLYTGKEVDFGTTIWKDFASYVFPKKKDIPCARFWALALQRGYKKLKFPLPEGDEMFSPRALSRYAIPDQSEFGKVARLPEAMLQFIEKNSKVLIRHIKETGPPEPERPTQSSQHTPSPTKQKKNALKVKKTTGKRKGEAIPAPQAKRKPPKSIPTSQKVNDVEKRSTVGSQSPISSSSQEDNVSQKHWDITHTQPLYSHNDNGGVEKSQDHPPGTHSHIKDQGPRGRPAHRSLQNGGFGAANGEAEVRTSENESVRQTREQSERKMLSEAESKKEKERKELVRMLWEEQQKREEEEWARTSAKLLEQAMSLGAFTNTGEEYAEDMEEELMFTMDDGLIQDSESPSITEPVKPCNSKVFLGTSDTESEHIEEVPNGEINTLPTKWKKKKSKSISRVGYNSLNQKLSEVLEAVKNIPQSEEEFVSKEEFGEMQKIVTSLAQSVPNLEAREETLWESIVNSTVDALRDMEQKRNADTFKYLDQMDEMEKTVKEIQQSYDDLTNTMGHQHGDEIVRISEQLCDYRNKNIILQAVLVKVMQFAQQLPRPCNVRFDEVHFAMQKVQNSVDILPKTLCNDELSKQVQQSFLKVFELIEDLKGSRVEDEAGFSSTKWGEDNNVVITETSEETHPPPPPQIDEVSKPRPPSKITIPETSLLKTFPVSEEEKKQTELEHELLAKQIPEDQQHALSPLVYVIRQLRDNELVPKQTTAPHSSDEYQWDIPMSPYARYYSVFPPLHPHLSREMQIPIELNRLEEFFKAHAQPPKDVWSLRRIIRVVGCKKKSFQKEDYFSFEVMRSDNKKYFFSEADFPNLNPNDLYVIAKHFQTKLLTHQPSRFPFLQIQRFLRSLTYDLGSIDAERFDSFVDNPPEEMNQYLEGIENRHRGPTEDPELGIIFSNEKDSPRLFFRLKQKHRCTTEFLEKMINLTLRPREKQDLNMNVFFALKTLGLLRSEDIEHDILPKKPQHYVLLTNYCMDVIDKEKLQRIIMF
ncbi:unnamed protein product [Lactuca saligna]|uniref:Uncharacterized protein n=1 Tax=Lactuca saligna TaxID=75948 RepID=A0AA35ZPM1_LACSI|nr:unnamed protein product [Lactuca saligna]